MAFSLFTPFFEKVDTATNSFVSTISSNAIAEITPIVSVALTLTFICFALAIIGGKIQMPVQEFLARSVRVALITSVALAGGLYQSQIAGAIRETPDEFAAALLGGGSGTTAGSVLDDAAGKGFKKAAEAFDKAGFFEASGWIYGFYGIIILLATAVLTAIGGAFVMLAKLFLALLAGLGPIFIAALIWQATSRFFEAWVGQVVNYALVIVLFASLSGLMMGIYGSYMADMKFDGSQNIAYALGGSVILSVAMIVMLLQLPQVAAGLAGGATVGFLYEMRALKGMARGLGMGGGKRQPSQPAGSQAGSSGAGGGRTAGSGGKSRGLYRGSGGGSQGGGGATQPAPSTGTRPHRTSTPAVARAPAASGSGGSSTGLRTSASGGAQASNTARASTGVQGTPAAATPAAAARGSSGQGSTASSSRPAGGTGAARGSGGQGSAAGSSAQAAAGGNSSQSRPSPSGKTAYRGSSGQGASAGSAQSATANSAVRGHRPQGNFSGSGNKAYQGSGPQGSAQKTASPAAVKKRA